ncbi:unnamed protein product [Schistosoma turkestanicum]|nr:unnamed protein product [Schistosoma turkestanicum]
MDSPRIFFVLLFDGYFKVKRIVWGGNLIFPSRSVDSHKQKILDFSVGANSLVQINISVFVLFHELYPSKEASTIPVDRDGILSTQDFITALHKMDLELPIEEAHFIFQTNHLPLSLFRSVHPGVSTKSNSLIHCKPGTSSSVETCEVEVVADPDISASVLPSSSPTFVAEFPPISPTNSWVEQNNRDSVDAQSVSLLSLNLDSDEEKVTSNVPTASSHKVSSIESVNSGEVSVQETKFNRLSHPTERSRDCSGCDENTSIYQIIESTANTSQRDSAGNALSVLLSDGFSKSSSNIQKSDDNSWTSNVSTQSVNYAYQKTDLQIRCESSSSSDNLHRRGYLGDNKESNNMIQCSSSSDSELDYKFDREYSIRYNNLQNSRSLKLVDTNSVLHTPGTWLLDNSKLSKIEHKRIRSESIDKPSGTELQILAPTIYDQHSLSFSNPKDNVYEKSSSSTCSNSAASKRSDRYIRDIDILEVAGVPFSYEDVVYSTNEEFRQLRATRGLTEEQLTAMSDARRRATNRQAAERCRRFKVAARDELAERLADLRLERQTLTKRLVKARQRKRDARDNLTEEQNRLLHMLHDSNGCTLKPSDWRIHLTTEDEIVVVSVGH